MHMVSHFLPKYNLCNMDVLKPFSYRISLLTNEIFYDGYHLDPI